MTNDSEIYRTMGLLPSDLSSNLEATIRLALGDEVSRVRNISTGRFLDSDLLALGLSSNQREFEDTARAARNSFTVSSAQEATALGVSALFEHEAVAGSAIGSASTLSTGLSVLGTNSKLSVLDEAARLAENSYSASLGTDAAAVFVNSLASQVESANRIASAASPGLLDSQLSAISASAHLTAFEDARRWAESALPVCPETVESTFLKSHASALSSSSSLSPLIDAARLAKSSFTAFFETDAAVAALKRVTEPAKVLQSQMDWYDRSLGVLKGINSLGLHNESALSRSKPVTDYLDRVAGLGALSDAFEQTLKTATLPNGLFDSIAEFSKAASGSERFFSSSLADLTGNLGRFDAFRGLHDTTALRVFEAAAEAATAHLETDEGDEDNYQQAVIAHLRRTAVEVSEQPTELQVLKSILSTLEALLKSNQQSAREKWLIAVLIPLLFMLFAAVLNPVVDFYVKRNLEALTARETAKAVKEDARDQVENLRLLSEHRFVSSAKLSVMMSPKAKSPLVGSLRKGAVVRVLNRDGRFTLVSWRSEDGNVEIKGWVFARYLERFS